jgi:small subunit ribosomal protein S1
MNESNVVTNGQGSVNGTPSFADLLDLYEYPNLQPGNIVRGELLRIENDVLYIDIGGKRDAVVPYDEMSRLPKDLVSNLAPGDEVPVMVVNYPVGESALIVSLEKGLAQEDWVEAQELMEQDVTVNLEVVGYNKGGLLVQFKNIRGFVPNSHEPKLRRINEEREEISYKSRLIGETLPLKIIELDESRERLVLSATAARRDLRDEQLEKLEPGSVVTGRVVNIVPYGVFLDLGYVTGLLHVSKISWDKVDHPQELLQLGDEVEVLIEKIDADQERISLNRRDLLPNPWQHFASRHEEGTLINGEITALVDFGAFVFIEPGIEGLIHVSELEGTDPEAVLSVGDQVLARIIGIDTERERLGLSLTQVTREEQEAWMLEKA